jgi:hypothetical protein
MGRPTDECPMYELKPLANQDETDLYVTRLKISFNYKKQALWWIRHFWVVLAPRQQFGRCS